MSRDVVSAIQSKVAAGSLPPTPPQRVWAGRSSGAACDGCGGRIPAGEPECEFDSPSGAIRLHMACLAAWENAHDRVV